RPHGGQISVAGLPHSGLTGDVAAAITTAQEGKTMSEGKVAVITGASSGIGKAVAAGLSKAGFRVAILGRRHAELDAAAAESGAAYHATCDVSDPVAVQRF